MCMEKWQVALQASDTAKKKLLLSVCCFQGGPRRNHLQLIIFLILTNDNGISGERDERCFYSCSLRKMQDFWFIGPSGPSWPVTGAVLSCCWSLGDIPCPRRCADQRN
ncbi:hypothetical protein BRADI_2g30824v3 [Brachypodium distachyon]|uniref:Uncharacterized protein n=1 Tax=Brachypodium distachyon TaxID=15368 RepID=A0A2K2DB86_BRADI|nr:hypothetical protein BRADI_2g30824v3 [Brachypodium distachyon]